MIYIDFTFITNFRKHFHSLNVYLHIYIFNLHYILQNLYDLWPIGSKKYHTHLIPKQWPLEYTWQILAILLL